MRLTSLWIILFSLAIGSQLPAQTPWTDTSLSPARRAGALLAAMTQAEKLAMVSGGPAGYIGNIPANARLGIPPIQFQDGPAGVGDGLSGATAFPAPIAMAATWDVPLMRQYGTYIGQEEHGKGGSVLLGPTMNMARAYQNGRAFESYGEDPFLSSAMAAAHVLGVQSQGVLANAKHFVANDEETDRWLITSDVSERALQEIYYQPFRAAVRSGVGVFMAAYNRINGRFACESEALNATVKKRWGYDGWIMSDWAAYLGTVMGADNGLDMDMHNGAFSAGPLGAAIDAGLVPPGELNSMVFRILFTMFRIGMFDHPATGNIGATVTTPEHAKFDCDAAAAGTVLLKNQGGVLPLQPRSIHSIAMIGTVAGAVPIPTGLGSANVVTPYSISPVAGITKRAGADITVKYSEGDGHIQDAVALARSSDVAIVCVGKMTFEGEDRPNLSLPGDQDELVSAVAEANPHTIVVLYCSSSTLMPWIRNVAGALIAWYPGQENGNALAQVLFGDVNPSAKLPVSIPASQAQVPANTPEQFPGVRGHAVYSEGLDIGYRWYDDKGVAPLFPFGHGLSYTSFNYSNLSVGEVSKSGQAAVRCDITNTGSRAGAEVPQLYLGFPAADGEPPKLLKGFVKVTLQPGETQHVSFPLDWQDLAHWDIVARGFTVSPGTYDVLVGASSRDLRLKGSLTVGAAIPSSDLANAAQHKEVKASSNPSEAQNALDGDPTTEWAPDASSGPQWIQVDLGMFKDLSRVRLQWGKNFAASYTLQGSLDGTAWTPLYHTAAGQGGTEDILVSGRARFIRLLADASGQGFSMREMEVYSPAQRPFGGKPALLPARIEAENFDTGGENVGYYNPKANGGGNAYRPADDMGIEPTQDTGGGYDAGPMNPGEWLEYTVNVPDRSAIYRISARVASNGGGGQIRVRLDGALLGTLNVPDTGGAQNWRNILLPNVPLAGGVGSRALRLEVLGGGFSINWIQLDRLELCGNANIALNRTAAASSSNGDKHPASAAFDGDVRSSWISQSSDPQWLQVDLGSIQHLARVHLDWMSEDWNPRGYGNANYSKAFSVQLSNDGQNWVNAYSTKTGSGSTYDLAISGNARFVRMFSSARINGNGNGLYEFEVYPGFAAPAATPAPAQTAAAPAGVPASLETPAVFPQPTPPL